MQHTAKLAAAVLVFAVPFLRAQGLPAPPVQSSPTLRLQAFHAPGAGRSPLRAGSQKGHATLTVEAGADWTATGIHVAAGDTLTFEGSGSILLAGHTLTPEGMLRGWRDMLRHFPVDSANAGALVGRIGNSAAAIPFTVGAQSSHPATQDGELYLRINSSTELPATGSFNAKVSVVPPAGSTISGGMSAAVSAGDQTSLRGNLPGADAVLLSTFTPALLSEVDALPRRVADRDGTAGDAINFAFVGTEAQVRTALDRAGWVEVDSDASTAVLHGLLNTLQHKPYLEVPMSTLYLFGRPQDLGYARASAITVASDRHHLRCWRTGLTANGAPVWVGAATHDTGLERDARNGHVTHRIAPEIDLERDFLRDSFLQSGSATTAAYFTPLHPVRDASTATGGNFLSDGRMLLLFLR